MTLLGLLFIAKSLDTKHSCQSSLWTGFSVLHGLKEELDKQKNSAQQTHLKQKGNSGRGKGKSNEG